MLVSIALFELRSRLSRLSAYVYFALFFFLAFLMMIAAGGAFSSVAVGTGTDKVLANSPILLNGLTGSISYFALFVVAAVFGQAVCQDYESNSYALFFTAPMKKRDYLGGRFLGAFLFMTFVLSGIALGLWAGTVMPFVEPSQFGPNWPAAYLRPYLLTTLPNLLIMGSIFFSLALLTRKMTPVYVGGVALFMGYLIASTLDSKIENKLLAALMDPFGMKAVSVLTEYWTVAEQNALLVPFQGALALNRLIWLVAAAALFAFAGHRFRFSHGEGGTALKPPPEPAAIPTSTAAHFPPCPAGSSALLARLTWLNFKETVKNVYFLVILLAAALFFVAVSRTLGDMFGTSTYPVTALLLEVAQGSFGLFLLVIITLYSGELVWRERDAKIDQIMDALPIPSWLPLASKLLSLILVQVLLLGMIMACSVALQTVKGYFHYEPGLYLKELFGIGLINYGLLCVLAISVQTIVNNKYLGHFVMVLYYLVPAFMNKLGLEHNLYKINGAPSYTYSDMNGYGHLLRPVLWFDLYWAAFALLLAILANLFWVRGLETDWRVRMALARRRFSEPARWTALLAAAVFAAAGGFIFYNTNVLNVYRTGHDREEAQADYERLYKTLARDPQPRVVGVKVDFDLHPESLELRVRGTYALKNKTRVPIRTVYVNLPNDVGLRALTLGALDAPTRTDKRLGFHTFTLKEPLRPGASASLDFDLEFQTRGFKNKGQKTDVVENGTFFNSGSLPSLGYAAGSELERDNARRKYGLAPKERMPDVEDKEGRKNNYITSDADWVSFEAVACTSPDQIAIAPGYLQKEWLKNGRRCFQYKMDAKILHFFSLLSARYEIKRDRWRDVALEIYYHRGHEYNLQGMMDGMKAALAYCGTQFGPYQHRQARIIEFPRYQTFAQAFPNTIPYSEGVGFIAKVDPDDAKDLDYPFYITAHEIAHQWWAHQLVGGHVQGATMLSETLSQYTALMVMKERFGPARMKKFLRYELEHYLSGRASEKKKEVPLMRVENQGYIHYNKGSLVMYTLQDYIGEAAVNRALSAYLKAKKFQEPPYTNSPEMLAYIRKETPPQFQYLIKDLFETITLYDNRAISAIYKERGQGRFEVKLKVSAKKLRAGELGTEKETPMDDFIDIGVVDDKDVPIFLERRRLKAGETEISFEVDRRPVKAGIDPLNKLIDRKPDDNNIRIARGT